MTLWNLLKPKNKNLMVDPKIKDEKTGESIEPNLTIRCGYHLINECLKTNAEDLKLTRGLSDQEIDDFLLKLLSKE